MQSEITMALRAYFIRLINFWNKINSYGKIFIVCIIYWSLLKYIKNYSETQHIAFISATYYKNSSIYPSNTIVILYNSQKNRYLENRLVCETWVTNENSTQAPKPMPKKRIKDMAHIRPAFLPIPICEWTTFIAICKAAENANHLSLSTTKNSLTSITVPLRPAYPNKHDVISCFSPLFYNERWQLLLTSLEAFRQFGVNLQIFYVQSIRKELYDLLNIYEKTGDIAIESWTLIDLGYLNKNAKDPNKELDWRNQGAAHTDCFLKYRESADFIIISDIDDILFPRLGKSYIQEFQHLALQNPSAAGFTYNRYNAQIATSKSSSNFSFSNLLSSIQVTDEWENGKSVVIPSKVETIWIHYPSIIKSGYRMITVSEEKNFMVHFRNWTMTNLNSDNINHTVFQEFQDPQMSDIFNLQVIDIFAKNANKFISENAKNEFKALSSDIHYYPLIEKCYDEIFYSKRKNVDACPGPIRCKLPPFIPGFSCVIAKKKYLHKTLSKNLEFHLPMNKNEFELSFDGCRM